MNFVNRIELSGHVEIRERPLHWLSYTAFRDHEATDQWTVCALKRLFVDKHIANTLNRDRDGESAQKHVSTITILMCNSNLIE